MNTVSKVKRFKLDKETGKEPFIARKISDFLGNGFAHTDIFLRRTKRTFKNNDAENQYDLEIIAGSIRVIGTVVNREVVPEEGAVLEKLPSDAGSPGKGEEQEVENFDVIFKQLFSGKSDTESKVLHANLDKSAEENGIEDAQTTKKRKKQL